LVYSNEPLSKAMAGQASVKDCEDYVQKHGVQDILKNCIAKICQDRPAQPYKWLKDYFDKLERVWTVANGSN